MPKFRVGTFYERTGKPPMKSKVRGYTTWYVPSWDGCVEYDIEAESGAKAKAEACERRLQAERMFYVGHEPSK